MKKKLLAIRAKVAALTPKEIDREVVKVLVANRELVLDLNREQLLQGKNAKGQSVGTYRGKAYAKYKKKLNPRAGGKVDLKLTGRFHDNFYLRTDPKVRVWSRDLKVDPLIRKYGRSIFGLSPQSQKALAKVIIPQILKRLRRRVGL